MYKQMKEMKEKGMSATVNGVPADYQFSPSEIAFNRFFDKIEMKMHEWFNKIGWYGPAPIMSNYSQFGEAED